MFEGRFVEKIPESVRLAKEFKMMAAKERERSDYDDGVFEELEADLESAGFVLAGTSDVVAIFEDQKLLCRSESFEKIIGLLMREQKIELPNPKGEPICATFLPDKDFEWQ